MRKHFVILICPLLLAFAFAPQDSGRAAAGAGKVLDAGDVPQENGTPGTIPPQATDIVTHDAPIHSDTQGTAQKELLDVAGTAAAGYAAAWRDGRDGNLGLYLGVVGPDGQPIGKDRSANAQGRSSRQLDPALALAADGSGAVVWRDAGDSSNAFFCRLFRPDGSLDPVQHPIGAGSPAAGARGGRQPIRPAVAVAPDKSALCTWSDGGNVLLQIVRPNQQSRAAPATLNRAEDPAPQGRPLVACAPDGAWLCVWPAQGGIAFLHKSARGAEDRGRAGAGVPLKLIYDAGRQGWWMLVEVEGARVLRHISKDQALDQEALAPVAAPRTLLDVASGSWGTAVLAGGGGGRGSSEDGAQVVFLAVDGSAGDRPPFTVDPSEGATVVGSPRIAASDDGLLVAWSERKEAESTVRCRLLPSKGEPGAVRTLTTDKATANQSFGDVDAAGDLAAVAWTDFSRSPPTILARTLSPKGERGPEIEVPAGEPAERRAAPQRPAIGVDETGRFLVLWSETGGERWQLRAQAFDRAGKPLGPPALVEGDLPGAAGSDVVALGGDRGWGVAWSRGESAVFTRRLATAGEPQGAAVRISTEANVGEPSLAVLLSARSSESLRLVAAWDVRIESGKRRLRTRFLDGDLAPQGREIVFDTMYRGSDWQPCVAGTESGGFAMIWTNGDERDRDVFARLFDGEGRPASRPLAISVRAHEQDYPTIARMADGSLVAAWEDDISYYDFVYVRRIARDGKGVGPTVTLCQRPQEYLPQHTAPRVAAFELGLVAVWGDCRRSQGFDVYFKILGPRFDDVRDKGPAEGRGRK